MPTIWPFAVGCQKAYVAGPERLEEKMGLTRRVVVMFVEENEGA